MLVLSRQVGERILIGQDVVITLVRIDGNRVRLGIEAPGKTQIVRRELLAEQAAAVDLGADRSAP